MSDVDNAFNAFDIRRAHDRRLYAKPSAILRVGGHNTGWCETCQSYKPAPKDRHKGWKCKECKLTAVPTVEAPVE